MTDTSLPVGVHPQDLRSPIGLGDLPAAPPDQAGDLGARGRRPWAVDNDHALGIWQRAADNWTTGLLQVTLDNSGVSLVVGRQKGRGSLALWVPTKVPINGVMTATPAGVRIAPSASEMFNVPCLNVGDSLLIVSEASCYAGLLPETETGWVAWLSLENPVGGGLDVY